MNFEISEIDCIHRKIIQRLVFGVVQIWRTDNIVMRNGQNSKTIFELERTWTGA